MWTKLLNKIKTLKENFGLIFLILLITACVAVPLKMILFYKMMGISANFAAVWLITCVIIYLLFASFKNKWIPAILFFAFSFLMFADASYSSFFNRYLSVNMLGAAGLLGGVQESVKAVLKPKFFLLFADALLIFIALAVRQYGLNKRRKIKEQTDEGIESVTTEEEISLVTEVEDGSISPITLETEMDTANTGIGIADETAETDEENEISICEEEKRPTEKLKLWYNRLIHPFIAFLIFTMLLSGASGSYIIASAANQEFFSYHIKDAINKTSDQEELYVDPNELLIATGSYEKEISGPLFGVAKGRNLIVIQVESLQNMVVQESYNGFEITPNLNNLISEESIYFDNYYEQRGSGNTSDAEFATNNSIYGTINSYTYALYPNNYFKGLPWILKEKGYSTAAFHGYQKDFWSRETAYPAMGFDRFYSEEDFEPSSSLGMGIDDTEFFDQSMDYLKDMKQPFYGFFITLSNHFPFVMPTDYLNIPILEEDQGTIFGGYINSVNHTDYALGQFIQELKDAGLYEDSIIAIYGDHFGLAPNEPEIYEGVSRFLGKDYDYDTMMNVPCVIHIPGSGINQTISISGGQMDFMPTISYLMGVEKLDTLYFGQNLLTANNGFVAEQAYMTKGSFIQDDVIFEMAKDGVFNNSRAWNFKTGESVPLDQCKSGYLKSKMIIDSSEFYLKNDVLRKVLLERKSGKDLLAETQILTAPQKIVVAGAGNKLLSGTNSKEALDSSYSKDERYIKIKLDWSTEGSVIMRANNGYSSMNFSEIAIWMYAHQDAFLIIEQNEKMGYLMDGIQTKYPDLLSKIIPEVTSIEEYSNILYLGFANSIFSVNKGDYSEKQILEFIELNPVWAASISKDELTGNYDGMIKSGREIYARTDNEYILE